MLFENNSKVAFHMTFPGSFIGESCVSNIAVLLNETKQKSKVRDIFCRVGPRMGCDRAS